MHEEEAIQSGADSRSVEAGGSRGAGGVQWPIYDSGPSLQLWLLLRGPPRLSSLLGYFATACLRESISTRPPSYQTALYSDVAALLCAEDLGSPLSSKFTQRDRMRILRFVLVCHHSRLARI